MRELRNEESAAEGKERVRFAKFVPAGDYFDQCQHDPSFMQLRLLITYAVAHAGRESQPKLCDYQSALIIQHEDLPEPKDKRVPLVMRLPSLKAIDDWSFERRIRSRSEAIRQLVALGLKASAEE